MINLPDFMIIGVPRCGTSSLFLNLAEHPRIQRPLAQPLLYSHLGTGLENKELGFFVLLSRYKKGVKWYSAKFPPKKIGYLTFEASTYCGYYPERVKAILPEVKAILLLRNPVKRAWGQFWIKYHKMYQKQPLEMLTKNTHPTVKGGIYINIVKNWHKHFPKENLLILKSEDWFSNPREILKQIYEFLRIKEIYPNEILRVDPWTKAKKKYGYPEAPANIKKWLTNFYHPYNRQLAEYLCRDFGWEESKSLSQLAENRNLGEKT